MYELYCCSIFSICKWLTLDFKNVNQQWKQLCPIFNNGNEEYPERVVVVMPHKSFQQLRRLIK